MPATGKAYPMLPKSLGDKLIDMDGDTLKVMLLSAYTYAAGHQFLDQVKAAGTESTSAVYTAGGATLGSVTWTRTGDVYTLDAANVSWDVSVGTNAAYAVIYDSTPGTDATRPVIGYVNLDGAGGTVSVLGIDWNASGILTVTA